MSLVHRQEHLQLFCVLQHLLRQLRNRIVFRLVYGFPQLCRKLSDHFVHIVGGNLVEELDELGLAVSEVPVLVVSHGGHGLEEFLLDFLRDGV